MVLFLFLIRAFLLSLQLNSIMDRFAKEVVQKICSLFRYCSSIAPAPAQLGLKGRDELRKTSSQLEHDLSGATYIHNQEFQGNVTWYRCQYQAWRLTLALSVLYLGGDFCFVFLSHSRSCVSVCESPEGASNNISPATFKQWGES